jgi:hypothetical protein
MKIVLLATAACLVLSLSSSAQAQKKPTLVINIVFRTAKGTVQTVLVMTLSGRNAMRHACRCVASWATSGHFAISRATSTRTPADVRCRPIPQSIGQHRITDISAPLCFYTAKTTHRRRRGDLCWRPSIMPSFCTRGCGSRDDYLMETTNRGCMATISAAVPGTAIRCSSARPVATGTTPSITATLSASGSRGR